MSADDYNLRVGTDNSHGTNFEQQMTAYLAVCCSNNHDIVDWWIASNVGGLGALDDIVLYIKTGNGNKQLLFFQTKHRKNPSNDAQVIDEVLKSKYFESFGIVKKIMSEGKQSKSNKKSKILIKNTEVPKENMHFIFATNSSIIGDEEAYLNKLTNSYFFNTNPLGQAYQLKPYFVQSDDAITFRRQFSILPEQISANSDDLLEKIATELKTYFNCNNNFKIYLTVAIELTDEIEKWFKKKSKKLTFEHFKEIIAKLILSKFVQTPISDREYHKLQDCEFELWKEITTPFQLVVFDNENSEKKNFFNATNSYLFIKCDDNCIDVVIKCLKIGKQQKVVLKKSINSLAPFQQLLNEYEIQTFTCLSNLLKQNLIHLIGECSLLLQGRELSLKSLLSLNPDVANVLDVDDVISLISKNLCIEDELKQLPYYVPRSIPRIFLKKTVIVEKQNSYFIIIVNDTECVEKVSNVINYAYTESAVETKEVNFLSVTNNGINQVMLNLNKKYKSVHVLSFHEYESDFLFEWVTSTKNVSEIKNFIDNEIYKIAPIRQNEIDLVFNCSDKVLILGNPGMGKSFYLRFLANTYSTDSWILFVTLNELDYTKIINFQAYLDNYVSKMSNKSQEIFDIYFRKKSVFVLFDGFDEIAPLFEKEGLKIIKGALEMRLKIVVTSRFVKKNVLENNLDILSRTMHPFTNEDKMQFLQNYYLHEVNNYNNSNSSDFLPKVQSFVDQVVSNISLSSWDEDFTGVPLQCRLIAESFVHEFVEYYRTGILKLPKKLNLLSLYEHFIDNKFNIFWREKEDQPEKTSSQKRFKKQEFDSFMQNHMAAAVQIIFPSLNKKIPKEYLESIRNGDEKRGIITGVDSNDNPVFIHRTFAEYFAAKWLVGIKKAGSEEERTKYLKNLLRPEYNVFRDLFDRLVCSDCKLHIAVLNADKKEVLGLLERDGGEGENNCGRSAIHLLSTRGAKHEWREDLKEIIRSEKESHLNVLDVLLSRGVCDADEKDQVLGWTAQQYAEDRKAFGVIDRLVKYNQFNKSESVLLPENSFKKFVNVMLIRKERRFHDKDILLKMCFKYDYANLAANVVDLKSVERKRVEDFLKRCAEYDSVEFAKKLIQSRRITLRDLEAIKWEYKDWLGESSEGSLLHLAAIHGSRAVLELLLRYFQVDTRDSDGRTALRCACDGRKQLFTAQLLISRGADPFAKDKQGETPMYEAILRENRELMEFMTSFDVLKAAYGDYVNSPLDDRTALQWAKKAGNLVSVQQLINEGADPNATSSEGWTALHYACDEEDLSSAQRLVDERADPFAKNKRGETPMDYAIILGRNKKLKEFMTCFDVLKATYGDDVNASLGGRTALQWATYAENLVSVHQLVTAGADLNVTDSDGQTALHFASFNGNVEIVRLLIQEGAEVDVQDIVGETALHVAAWWGEKEVVEELVRSGAKTDIFDKQQRSALTRAREEREKETFLCLWPRTSHHTTDDIRYHTELTGGRSE